MLSPKEWPLGHLCMQEALTKINIFGCPFMYLEAQECESILSGPGRLGQSSHVCLSRFTKQKPPKFASGRFMKDFR